MTKYCPNCGYKLKDDIKFCEECGIELNTTKQVKIHQLPQKDKSSKNKPIIIVGLIVIVIILMLGIFAFISNNSADKILTSGDLQLNMTGYDYNLKSNTSTDSGYIENYDVTGNDDSFTLTIMVVDDTYNIGDVGNLGTTLTGTLNAVAVTKYINGKYYWIQLSGANDEHNTESYLESIIITQGSNPPTNTTTTTTTTSSSSSSTNEDEDWSETVETGEYDEYGDPIYETHGYSSKENSQYGKGYYTERWSANGEL